MTMRSGFGWRAFGWLVGLALQAGAARGQAPAWQWANAPGVGRAYSTVTDGAGNVYFTGALLGTAVFGTITLSNGGGIDAFVAKLSPN